MTKLVLRASHEKTYRREHLDQLCMRAADSFRMMDATHAASPDTADANEAMLQTGRATTIVVREHAEAAEFLCLLCDSPDELDQVINDARQTLTMIVAGV